MTSGAPPYRILIDTLGRNEWNLGDAERFRQLIASDTCGRHALAADDAEADAVLFVDVHQQPHDQGLVGLRRRTRGLGARAFVYDERDDPFVTLPGLYVSPTSLMRHQRSAAVAPYPPWKTGVPAQPDVVPDLLFSFAGGATHPVRQQLTALAGPDAVIRVDGPPLDRREYARLLARSRFVLCPRGYGSSSFRLFETLATGRVPVVISDAWRPPLFVDWESCIIRVPERDVGAIPALLAQRAADWPRLAAAAGRVHTEHFAAGAMGHYYARVLELLSSRSQLGASLGWAWKPAALRRRARSWRHYGRVGAPGT